MNGKSNTSPRSNKAREGSAIYYKAKHPFHRTKTGQFELKETKIVSIEVKHGELLEQFTKTAKLISVNDGQGTSRYK